MTKVLGPDGQPMLPAQPDVASAPARPRASLIGGTAPYDAGDGNSRDMSAWNPWLGSPDTELNPYRDRIVARLRDLIRNDGWAAGSVSGMLDAVIGAELRLVSKPDYDFLRRRFGGAFDAVWAKEFARAAQGEWRNFGQSIGNWCDVSRRMDMGEITRVAYRHKLVEGDGIGVMHWRPERVGPGLSDYATCVQLMDPDRMSNPDMVPDMVHLRGGVEIDDDGVAIAHHFRRAHQANWFDGGRTVSWERIPRETRWGRPVVIHSFDSDRAGQHRSGGGVLMPVVARLRMLARYDKAELDQAIINAIFGAYVESPYDSDLVAEALGSRAAAPGKDDVSRYQDMRKQFHDAKNIGLGGVRIPILFPGEKIRTVRADRPSSAFPAFEAAVLRNVAAATGQSESEVSRDYSRQNYSSQRAALMNSWKTLGRGRAIFVRQWCRPIYSCQLEEAMAHGRLPLPAGAPDFIEARTAYCGSRWMGPGRGWIDPLGERQGAVLGMDAGLSTLEMECAEQGLDWEEMIEQRALEIARFKELDMPLPEWAGGVPAQQVTQSPVAARRPTGRIPDTGMARMAIMDAE